MSTPDPENPPKDERHHDDGREARHERRAAAQWQNYLAAGAGVVAAMSGGGVFASHRAVSTDVTNVTAKMDEVLRGQQGLELKFAKLEGRDAEGTLRDHDARLRSLEAAVAGLKGR